MAIFGDLSCIISCLVLPGFPLDTFLKMLLCWFFHGVNGLWWIVLDYVELWRTKNFLVLLVHHLVLALAVTRVWHESTYV